MMRLRHVLAGIACMGIVAAASSKAAAALVDFSIVLNGRSQVAPVATRGTGAGWLELATETGHIQWSIAFGNLTSPPIAAHFHGPAAAGETAPPIVAIDHTSRPTFGSADVTEQQMQQLLDGLWYASIATELFPQGEIRGQVVRVVPEPATLAILAAGGLWVLASRRRA